MSPIDLEIRQVTLHCSIMIPIITFQLLVTPTELVMLYYDSGAQTYSIFPLFNRRLCVNMGKIGVAPRG